MTVSAANKRIAKKSGSNFISSFACLPAEQRDAMAVFYAFCRVADDIVDEKPLDAEKARQEIQFWSGEIKACYAGAVQTELGRDLERIIKRFKIPRHLFDAILEGVEMDLTHARYGSFEQLEKYCRKVASAVGLVSIRIFECARPESEEYAVALGLAFQLTNILRDVRHDLEEYGRVYLPQDEMKMFGVAEEDLRGSSEKCEKLFRLQYLRAKHYYNRARRLIHSDDRPHLSAALIMTEVYEGILEKIRRNNFRVLEGKISLSRWEKIGAVLRGWSKKRHHVELRPPSRVAVWGGGFAGMSAAVGAALAGHRVELYEAKSYWGGRAHSFREAKTGQILDNGQHIMMGCYRECLSLFDLLGVRGKLREPESLILHFCSEAKGMTSLKTSKLPFPFHLLAGLIGFKELRWRDRFSILWMGNLMTLGFQPQGNFTVEQWLRSWGQTDNAVRALWEPLCVAALNEPIDTACAKLFYQVVRRSVFGSASDSAVYLSKVGLSDLLMPEAAQFLKAVGGQAHLNCGVKEVQFEGGRIQSFTTTKGSQVKSDVYISALPWNALRPLLPEGHALRGSLEKIESAPIVGIYLWTDRPLMKEPIVGLLDSPIQWIFDRSSGPDGYQYAVVISGAYDQKNQTGEEILSLVLKELNRLFLEAQNAQVRHSFVYKSLDATFAGRPNVCAHRPLAKTAWQNLFLAGDWTLTHLPATLESAATSARRAVEVVG